MRRCARIVGFAALLAVMHGIDSAAEADDLCHECIELRVGRPMVIRGPSRHEPDAPVSVIRLPDGGFRGFARAGRAFHRASSRKVLTRAIARALAAA